MLALGQNLWTVPYESGWRVISVEKLEVKDILEQFMYFFTLSHA